MMSEKDSLGETHPEQIVQSETGQGKKLFRANAVRVARERAFYGSVSVNTPIPYIVISAIAAIFIIAIVFGLFFLEYDHKVSGKGVARVKEGEYTISSPIAGNLSELKAELGAHVKVGQVIAIIKAPRQTATGKSYFKELTHISE
ncbi:biotin/lipoyl-binding protein, partial [Pseudomonas syringae]